MYTAESRVLHVNKIAGVPETLVEEAKKQGKPHALKEIPAGKGNPLKVIQTRLQDLAVWPKIRSRADLIHVHYVTNGYYGWGSKPFVIHVHGSDIRRDWNKPILRQVITTSLKRADKVLYSTPDLYEFLEGIRPDAIWAPNPVPYSFFDGVPSVEPRDTVVFSSRWDNTKGIDLLLPLAKILVDAGVEVHGIDWGTHQSQAREAGVQLHPMMGARDFSQFLSSAHVVVGQMQFPALSMTDYQTLALNKHLVCAANVERPPAVTVACGTEAGLERDPAVISEAILKLLDEPGSPNTRDWVLKRHHPAVSLAFMEEIYKEILG